MIFTLEDAIIKAKEIEKKYNVRVSVIKKNENNEHIFGTGFPSDYGIFIFENDKDKHKKFIQIQQDLETENFMYQIDFHLGGMVPVEDLIKFAKANPTLLRQWLALQGPLATFLYHDEVYGTLSNEIRTKLIPEFPEIPKLILDRIQRITKVDEMIRKNLILYQKKANEIAKKKLLEISQKPNNLASVSTVIKTPTRIKVSYLNKLLKRSVSFSITIKIPSKNRLYLHFLIAITFVSLNPSILLLLSKTSFVAGILLNFNCFNSLSGFTQYCHFLNSDVPLIDGTCIMCIAKPLSAKPLYEFLLLVTVLQELKISLTHD